MKIDKLEAKAQKAARKTQTARDKIPKKKKLRRVRIFDIETGKVRYSWVVVQTDKKERKNLSKKGVKVVKGKASNEIHKKVSEVAQENDAVKAVHKTEQAAEKIIYSAQRHHKTKQQRLQKKVQNLQKKEIKINTKYQYQKFLKEHPEYDKKAQRKQKRKIKKDYAEKLRMEKFKSVSTLSSGLKEVLISKKHKLLIIGVFGLLFLMLATFLGSCGAMFAGGGSGTFVASYASKPKEIDKCEERFTELENTLQNTIGYIETWYSGYDEYRYNIGPIGHNPFELINYISAKYNVFTYEGINAQIDELFAEMYQLSFTEKTETRIRMVEKTGYYNVTRPNGTTYRQSYTYQEEEEYEVSILECTLSVKSIDQLAQAGLSEDEKKIYEAYKATHGGLQQFASPLELYWYNYMSSFFGYRKNPTTGLDEYHYGLDISVPDGNKVYASMDCTVSETGTDTELGKYICLSDSKGYLIKYAHLSEVSVSNGESISKGMAIGKTGHSGICTEPHLHLEISKDGEYYNPVYYFNAKSPTLYGERYGDTPEGVTPPESYSDEAVRRLMEEADRYVNYPYVWGGSNPSTSFDCSGYVCYVVTNSGFSNLPRTTAQGIYNQCTPISRDNAEAGDLVFFTKTYNSGTTVTHVGIYCGNGVMVHCGDPIKYASIDSAYWANHFYSFGRLRR